jgi:hypothetical protein
LHNPSRANLIGLVLAVRDGAQSFDPPDGDTTVESDAPASSPAERQRLEPDNAVPSAASVDVELDEDIRDSDAEAAEITEQCADS